MPQAGSKLSRIHGEERNMMIHKICKIETGPLVQRSVVAPVLMPERRLFPKDPQREASTVLQTGISVMAFW